MTFRPSRIVAAVLCAAVIMSGVISASSATVICGDADGDGTITIMDATCIQRVLAELPVSSFSLQGADINASGGIDITEATMIQRWLADMETTYPIGDQIEVPAEPPTQMPTDEEGWGRVIFTP